MFIFKKQLLFCNGRQQVIYSGEKPVNFVTYYFHLLISLFHIYFKMSYYGDDRLEHSLSTFNGLPDSTLRVELLRCCGSKAWVDGIIKEMPFSNMNELLTSATTVWFNLPVAEWHTAFKAHPQIGKQHHRDFVL